MSWYEEANHGGTDQDEYVTDTSWVPWLAIAAPVLAAIVAAIGLTF